MGCGREERPFFLRSGLHSSMTAYTMMQNKTPSTMWVDILDKQLLHIVVCTGTLWKIKLNGIGNMRTVAS